MLQRASRREGEDGFGPGSISVDFLYQFCSETFHSRLLSRRAAPRESGRGSILQRARRREGEDGGRVEAREREEEPEEFQLRLVPDVRRVPDARLDARVSLGVGLGIGVLLGVRVEDWGRI